MATTKKDTKKVKYVEPEGYIPKAIFDKYFGDDKKKTAKKTGTKKK